MFILLNKILYNFSNRYEGYHPTCGLPLFCVLLDFKYEHIKQSIYACELPKAGNPTLLLFITYQLMFYLIFF